MNIKLLVAAHKKYEMPKDKIYLPVQVGSEGKDDIGYTRDNTGDNISALNPMYCELTGLYWAWKNLDADYIGLVHYRRYFKGKSKGESAFDKVLTKKEAEFLLKRYDIILPQKRRYYIESLYSHYVHTHQAEEMDMTRNIIEEKYNDYIAAYDKTMKQTSGYMFNMMIMSRKDLDDYCNWMFSIVDELVKRVPDIDKRSDFEKRFPGRISEILLNVWLNYRLEKGIITKDKIAEIPFIYMEKINYLEKGMSFLSAKFFHKRQKHSF